MNLPTQASSSIYITSYKELLARGTVCGYVSLVYLVSILNVCEVGSFSKARGLVEVPQIWPDVRVVHNPLLIALNIVR